MGRPATKAKGNIWYQARMQAAMGNEKLLSRFGAAEETGLSEDAIKSAELGLYKSMPVENAVLMADTYNAPELLNYYCLNECPIGQNKPLSVTPTTIERATVRLLKRLREQELNALKDKLLEITDDGVVTDDEVPALKEVMDALDDLSLTISELKTIGEKLLKGVR